MTQSTATMTKASLSLSEKEEYLRNLMHEFGAVLVAFSGGVDSAYLALVAKQELGAKALCITGLSPSVSLKEREMAAKIARDFDFNYRTIETEELSDPNYAANPSNRCYFCKSELYGKLKPLAAGMILIDGSNIDDLGDYRPGREAAKENGVRSPLIEAGLSKAEIRELSKSQGLETWDKPSSPCLSSRIQYGIPVSIERLGKVERGEEILRAAGFREFRVRYHSGLARLEIAPSEMNRILAPEIFEAIADSFRLVGFQYVALDMHGYRSGAMNESLERNLKL